MRALENVLTWFALAGSAAILLVAFLAAFGFWIFA